MSEDSLKVITLEQEEILSFCGDQDRKLKKIQSKLKARIIPRGNELRLSGSEKDVEMAFRVINDLIDTQHIHQSEISERQIDHVLDEVGEDPAKVQDLLLDTISVPNLRNRLTPLTKAQKHYIQAIRTKDVVFCIGPAGTGKTYLAVAMAVESLVQGKVKRIILVRPAVEAGERLGFLPGDISEKFDPYVRPLYDALYEMLDPNQVRDFKENGVIEIAPLAYMRGRTLNHSFVILDEAQNTSREQMKMFLTRMGFDSKMVITGDVTQSDLPDGKTSGLMHSKKVLGKVEGIEFIHFASKDVVRHRLVQKIVAAYESHGKKK